MPNRLRRTQVLRNLLSDKVFIFASIYLLAFAVFYGWAYLAHPLTVKGHI